MPPHVDRHDDLRQAQDVQRRDRDAGASQRIHASQLGRQLRMPVCRDPSGLPERLSL